MYKWPKVDRDHSHCHGCNVVFRNAQLTYGFCAECVVEENKNNRAVKNRAEAKAVAKASTQFLAAMRDQGKTGASMPRILGRFIERCGGEEGLADKMYTQFEIAMGEPGEDGEPSEGASLSLRKDWFDLINRHTAKTDENKSLDVGSLEEADLEAILSNLALKALQEDASIRSAVIAQAVFNEDQRREMFNACLRADPKLVTEILESNGRIIDSVATEKNDDQGYIEVEDEDDSYDPSEDEYKD